MLDGVERGCTRTAVIAGDKHHVGMALGHTCGDGADAELGNELDVDTCLRVGHLRIVDQLLQILDGVDVVVRRRGDSLIRSSDSPPSPELERAPIEFMAMASVSWASCEMEP